MRKEISPEKLRDMTRSILPSIARTYARRAKAGRKRRVRRGIRQDIHQYSDESSADLLRDVKLSDVIDVRRGADKLNHFMRWCEALTRGMPAQLKLDTVRALLPKSLIGDHAYTHWEVHCEFLYSRGPSYKEQRERNAQSLFDRMRHALRKALANDPTILGVLNAEIKRRKLDGEPRRLLRGVHDVDAFVREIVMDDRGCLFVAERKALRSFTLLE